MNDFNRGALPVPCLRLDHGFGEQWESIELGDGTGYVRLAEYEKATEENAKLRSELESVGTAAYLYGRGDLKAENDKLRELVYDMLEDEERGHNDELTFYEHVERANELGVGFRG